MTVTIGEQALGAATTEQVVRHTQAKVPTSQIKGVERGVHSSSPLLHDVLSTKA